MTASPAKREAEESGSGRPRVDESNAWPGGTAPPNVESSEQSPRRHGLASAGSASAGGRGGGRERETVRREDVLIVPLYNNLYLVHIEQQERRLVLYSVGVQARPLDLKLFIQSRSEEPFQLRLAVGVVDNVLLLHDLEGRTSMMYIPPPRHHDHRLTCCGVAEI